MDFQTHPVLREFDRLNGQIDELYHAIALRQGLSDSAYAVLQAMLVLGEGCTQTEVCRYALLNKQTVHSAVRKLLAEGILTLRPGAGRERKLYLTGAGEQLVREKIVPVEEAENQVFAEMTAEEQQAILRLMSRYLQAFQEKLRQL